MKKSIILFSIMTFVVGVISLNVYLPYEPTFEEMPISINKNSWRVERPSPGHDVFVEFEITNNGKKTVKNIMLTQIITVYRDDMEQPHTTTGVGIVLKQQRGNTSVIRNGQTVVWSSHVKSFGLSGDSLNALTPVFDKVSKIEVVLYINWIQFTWLGGQWGDMYGALRYHQGEFSNLSSFGVIVKCQPYIRE